MKKIFILLLLTLSFASVRAGDNDLDRLYPYSALQYGPFADFGIALHNVDFRYLPGYPSCSPGYKTGTGIGLSGGGFIELPFLKYFFAKGKIGLDFSNAKFYADDHAVISDDNNYTNAVLEHSISLRSLTLNMDLLAGVRYKQYTAAFGLRNGYFLYNTFDQKERLNDPPGYVFTETGTRDRNLITGVKVKNAASIRTWFTGMLQYELIADERKSYRIAPYIGFAFSTNSYVKDSAWNISDFRIGAEIKFSRPKEYGILSNVSATDTVIVYEYPFCNAAKAELYEFLPEQITVVPSAHAGAGLADWECKFSSGNIERKSFSGTDKYPEAFKVDSRLFVDDKFADCKFVVRDKENKVLSAEKRIVFKHVVKDWAASITYKPFTDNGRKIIKDTLTVEKTISTNIRPLLNYIFFDEGKSELPARYKRISPSGKAGFRYDALHNLNSLETYYNVLNIFGKLAEQNPEMKLSLVGCSAGLNTEEEDLKLAENRAQSVKQYFVQYWNIPEDRIETSVSSGRNALPEKATSSGLSDDSQYAIEENRRVEIYIDTSYADRINPIRTVDTLLDYSFTKLNFYPQIKHDVPVSTWSLKLFRKNELLGSSEGTAEPPKEIVLNMKSMSSEIYRNPTDLDYEFEAVSEKGQTCKLGGKVPVSLTVKDSTVEKASLILFEFNRFDIRFTNRKIVNIIQKQIKNGANVIITGFADIIGDSLFNRKLSINRARATAESIFDTRFAEGSRDFWDDYSADDIMSNDPFTFTDVNGNEKRIWLTVKGRGEKNPLVYPNDTPEGRFYSRTVTIEIKNPIK